jgi:hypothetical protein
VLQLSRWRNNCRYRRSALQFRYGGRSTDVILGQVSRGGSLLVQVPESEHDAVAQEHGKLSAISRTTSGREEQEAEGKISKEMKINFVAIKEIKSRRVSRSAVNRGGRR